MQRNDKRDFDQIRDIKIERNVIKYPKGSCLISCGQTRVICTATVEESVPLFLKGSNTGWLSAEYGMLPASTNNRIPRDKKNGRVYEIQRLIGRALRSVINLKDIGERTIKIDCDVLQADGGTRTASITGGFIALADCLKSLKGDHLITKIPLSSYLAAVSVGIVEGNLLLDLNYQEDSSADVDMNVVANSKEEFVELQGTAEKGCFSRNLLNGMLDLSLKGIKQIIDIEKDILKLNL